MISKYDERPAAAHEYNPYQGRFAPASRGFSLFNFIARAVDVIARQRIWFISALAVGLVAILAVLTLVPKTYEATARVLVVAANNARDPSIASIDLPSVATSTAVLSAVREKLGLPLDLLLLKKSVKARVSAKSSMMEIGYRDKVADRAVAVPNAIADELVTYYDSLSSSGSDVTIHKLDVAIDAVQERLRVIDDAKARQAKLHPFVQSDKALDDATSKLDDLTNQRKLAAAALAADVAQRDAISGDPTLQSKVVRHEKLLNDPTYRELSTNIAKDEAQLAFDKAQFTEDNPELKVLEKKVSAERSLSGAHVESTLASADAFSSSEASSALQLRKADAAIVGERARLAAIDSLLAGATGRLHDTLGAGVFAERLKLQQDAGKADYLTLTGRRAAAVASQAEALSLGSLVVVDRAVRADTAVVGLGPARLGVVMAVFALALAIAVAFLADAFDSHLSRVDQIERFYGVPVLALIDIER